MTPLGRYGTAADIASACLYLASDESSFVTGQAVVNLGAVLGFLPLTGVPLPLISSGGSSLIVFLTLIGTLLNVAKGQRRSARKAVPADDSHRTRVARTKAAGPDRSRGDGGPRRAGAGGRRRAHG